MNDSIDNGIISNSIPFVNDIVIAILIVFLGFIIGKILGKVVKKVLSSFKIDASLKKTFSLRTSNVEKFISGFVSFIIYLVSIIMALNYVGVTTFILNILFVVIIVVVAISTILALKDLVPNLIAGIQIRIDELIREGDTIRTKDVEGEVIDLTLLDTKIKNFKGDLFVIPNSIFLKHGFVKVNKLKVSKKKIEIKAVPNFFQRIFHKPK